MLNNLEKLTALELGREVNAGHIKPSEVISYFKKRIEQRNEGINAIVYTKWDEAMKVALEQDKAIQEGKNLGPFAGVPFVLKDFLPSKPGWENTHGGVKCLSAIDDVYSPFTKAMEEAGAIAIGKANAPAYGFRGTTDNKMYGATSTPFNTDYNSGGSSGGSAASVADGLVLIAEGGDAGGSIRIPASFCNLYGFKAGVGTIPMVNRPDAYSATHPFCCGGGLTKSVEDSAVLLNYMAKYDPRDPNSVPSDIDYVKEMNRGVKGMKIAYTYDFDLFPLEEEVRKQFVEAIEKFKSLGIEVREAHFNFKHTAKQMSDAWCKGITVDCAIDLNTRRNEGIDLLKDHLEDFPEEFVYWKNECDKMGIMDLYDLNLVRSDILDNFEDVFLKYDLIISPTCCVAGIKNVPGGNTKGPSLINGVEVDPLIGWVCTYLANFTGNPACSIPCGHFTTGVPFGVQIIGKRHHEGDILALSKAFEDKYPWSSYYETALNRK